jgi:hypothetical protein
VSRILWTEAAKAKLAYQPGRLLAVGVADGPVKLEDLEVGAAMAVPKTDTPVVAYVWAINLQGGDQVEILTQDRAAVEKNAETPDRNKAQYMLFVGKKAPAGGWPKGNYHAEVKIMRDGKLALEAKSEPVALD